jgi:hypothetical protein
MKQQKSLIISGTIQIHRITILKPQGSLALFGAGLAGLGIILRRRHA